MIMLVTCLFHLDSFSFRSRSRSPVRKSRSRSRSPRDWKRNERDSRRGSRDQSMGINSKRVFVSNIHYDTRWMTLKDLFKTEGKYNSKTFFFHWIFLSSLTHWHLGDFNLILVNGGWGISYKIAFRRRPLELTDDKSTLVQVMAWCRQATSHYLSQCWPRSMSPNGVTRPQWVKYGVV